MSPQIRLERIASSLCLLAAIGAVATRAQPTTSFEFSFSNPGARSLGFGGAFVALADDATAAFANPAGLVQIAKTEVSLEGRSWSYRTPYTRLGRIAGEPSGLGIDTISGTVRANSSPDLSGLSYLSIVYPRKRWAIAFFHHQLAQFEFGLESQGLFLPGEIRAESERTTAYRSRLDLGIVSRGLAVALRPGDRLSLGVGITRYEPETLFQAWDFLPDVSTSESYFAEIDYRTEGLAQFLTAEMDAPDWGLTAGLLFRVSENWTVGGVYREGPETEVVWTVEAGPAHPVFPNGFIFVDRAPTPWTYPDSIGVGAAYRAPNGRWTGAVEWKRVEYSSILKSLLPQQREGITLDDADELHLGGEYAFFAGASVLALRLGAWLDPDHQFRGDGRDPLLDAVLPGGDDEAHLAAGFGVVLRGFQIDAAVDLSERIDTASLSVIYSF